MKKINYIALIAAAAMTGSLCSCELFQRNVKTEKSLPDDRENIEVTPAENYRSQSLERGEIGGYWAISEVAGKKAVGEEPPYLNFNIKEKKVYGNNGCNTLNASYTANPADSTLQFSNMLTTMRSCSEEGLSEIDINLAMANTARYTWHRDGLLYTITLLNAADQPLMQLVHQDYAFMNGTWTVISMNGNAVDNPDIKLVIDIEEQKIHGNTGCNILNGTLIPDMLENGAVTFTNLSTTRMMCPDLESETELLVALETAAVARPVDANTINLLNGHDQVILTLRRLPSDSYIPTRN
ncbi:MAG: META domain-containing protein [Prevotella sp.]|nr:META domain-containing protein [Prevotella sp.]MCM1074119.1 META domain-containing protein [Ruminococcus sp.]